MCHPTKRTPYLFSHIHEDRGDSSNYYLSLPLLVHVCADCMQLNLVSNIYLTYSGEESGWRVRKILM
ncbi:hypothetical protein QCA50_019502 [Cerrena zonata]|uniref:Uncharacterized protein n=1 Tax=Cerrena zonata TaxID=2478898 RepID=A0AAW0FB26_9APHY